jgi:hypothetical protein
MMARRWDALPEGERPITRQAYSTLGNARSVVLGVFFPFLVSTVNSATLGDFLRRNAAFLVSATIGGIFYLWSDPLFKRFPQIGRALERFGRFTERLNSRLEAACSRILKTRSP